MPAHKKPPKLDAKLRDSKLSREAKSIATKIIEDAKESGALPHEILLKAARGEGFIVRTLVQIKFSKGEKRGQVKEETWEPKIYYPTFAEQIECAKSAAAFYAPRLTSQTVKSDDKTSDALTDVFKKLASVVPA